MAQSLMVAAIQLRSGADVSSNLSQAEQQIRRAAADGARLVVLPENFAYFGPDRDKPMVAERLGVGGAIQDHLCALCSELSIYVVAGGMPEVSEDPLRPFNTSVVFAPTGRVVASYRKLHLFDVQLPDGQELKESQGTSPGDRVVTVDLDGFRVGLTVCYDLRFSQLFRKLSAAGAEILTVPAAFTEQTGRDHWHVLLRSRAIEWQSWVVAAGQWGEHPGERRSFGHSLLADPWGRVVAECEAGVGYCMTELTKQRLAEVRERLPRLKHELELA